MHVEALTTYEQSDVYRIVEFQKPLTNGLMTDIGTTKWMSVKPTK